MDKNLSKPLCFGYCEWTSNHERQTRLAKRIYGSAYEDLVMLAKYLNAGVDTNLESQIKSAGDSYARIAAYVEELIKQGMKV